MYPCLSNIWKRVSLIYNVSLRSSARELKAHLLGSCISSRSRDLPFTQWTLVCTKQTWIRDTHGSGTFKTAHEFDFFSFACWRTLRKATHSSINWPHIRGLQTVNKTTKSRLLALHYYYYRSENVRSFEVIARDRPNTCQTGKFTVCGRTRTWNHHVETSCGWSSIILS